MDIDDLPPFDAVAVDVAAPPNLDDQLSTHWETPESSDGKSSCLVKHMRKIFFGFLLLSTVGGMSYVEGGVYTSEKKELDSPPPSVHSRDEMKAVVAEISDSWTLLDPVSPQSKALDWLAAESIDMSKEHFRQRYALMVFFFSTIGNGWFMVEPWEDLGNVDECSFTGVDCVDNHVVSISLEARGLAGTLPQELGVLSRLRRLKLGRNDIEGSIPAKLFQGCLRLITFDVGGNLLTSTIPEEIGNLVHLREFTLTHTRISGTLPESMKALTHLTLMSLWRTNLEGLVFDFVTNWPKLQSILIGQSLFTGTLPTEIGELTALRDLLLDDINVNVTLPTEIGKLTRLSALQIVPLGAHGGSIPSEIGSLTKLVHLAVDGNLFTGNVPSEVGRLTSLTYLQISGGLITGTLPREIASLTALDELNLSRNDLHGNIPAEIGDLPLLTKLNMNRNNFEGRMPGTLCSIQSIFYDCSLTCDCCACSCATCRGV